MTTARANLAATDFRFAQVERLKSGRYRAPPVRRVTIPKGDGRSRRALGIPTFEDKVLQRAVTMVLEAVSEQDFEEFSYGFRPGRSAHQALRKLQQGLMKMRGGLGFTHYWGRWRKGKWGIK